MNSIKIVPVEYRDKEVLRNLMEFYLYDFSEFEGFDLYPHGRFEYKYLDHYWVDSTRFPFFIMVNNLYSGFVLVRKEEDGLTHEMTEFFVMRKYRRQGIGEFAAKYIFDQFPGKWEVRQVKNNTNAQRFWRKVISNYTDGNYKEKVNNDGLVTQSFTVGKEG